MAALGEMPFGRYYGSVDATPLFVLLAGAYYERTADRAFVESIWPNVEAALGWIDDYGDRDGDGFIEYERRAADGLIHQGWKDSDDAMLHADGTPASGPIALCEVQGYVYAARRAGAVLAAALGLSEQAEILRRRAEELRHHFEEAFWCEEMGTYALALDGEKRPCRVRSSNAGHCLFGGIAAPERAARVARLLGTPESFSGWGDPDPRHVRGPVQPDGISQRVGLAARQRADRPWACPLWDEGPHGRGPVRAVRCRDLFRPAPDAGAVLRLRPRAGRGAGAVSGRLRPQAWASAAVFLLLQGCLGLVVHAPERRIWLHQPRLPAFVPELRIANLEVDGAVVDLVLTRYGDDVGVEVARRVGELSVVVAR